MKKYLEWTIPGLVLVILVSLIIFEQPKKVLGGPNTAYRATSVTTRTTVGMSTQGVAGVASSTQVLAANTERFFARCQNATDGGQPISLMLGSTATSSGQDGYLLSPRASSSPSFLDLNEINPFSGAVYAYTLSTSTIVCTEN